MFWEKENLNEPYGVLRHIINFKNRGKVQKRPTLLPNPNRRDFDRRAL